MEADVWLERAVAVASKCTRLGMRLCALELCSVLLFVTKPLRYLALTCGEGCTPDRKVHSEIINNGGKAGGPPNRPLAGKGRSGR